jgi:membrane protease subunit HflK
MRSFLILLVVLILSGAYLLTGVVQVRPGERAVVRRFGRVLEQKPGPGLWVGLPWGMDRVDRVSVDAVRRVEIGYQPAQDDGSQETPAGQLLTGDHNLINLQVVLAYRVRENEVEEYVLNKDRVDTLVGRVAETVLAEWVGGQSVDDVLLQGQVALRGWLVAEAQQRLEPYQLGIEIQQADVAHLFPPAEVKNAFDEVTRAQTEIRTAANRAEQEAQRRLNEAQSERYRMLQLAGAYAREQRVGAEAEASSFEQRLQQYRDLKKSNPDFLRRVWLDEMGKLLARLKQNGQLDLLDRHLSGDGLDLTVVQPPPKKK